MTLPESRVRLAVDADSLRRLPPGAVYTGRSGQATATITQNDGVVYVTATCDSLQRQVEYYEELYWSARDELEQYEDSVRTESEQQSSNLLAKLITLFLIGFAAGTLTTIFIIIFKKREQ